MSAVKLHTEYIAWKYGTDIVQKNGSIYLPSPVRSAPAVLVEILLYELQVSYGPSPKHSQEFVVAEMPRKKMRSNLFHIHRLVSNTSAALVTPAPERKARTHLVDYHTAMIICVERTIP